MTNLQPKTRVIVRPWQPRRLPYSVSEETLHSFITTHRTFFDHVVYLGWVRRNNTGIVFVVATGPDRKTAKERFKTSLQLGTECWIIEPLENYL
jgi:hypothetical protein